MDRRLHDAVVKGDVPTFRRLLKELKEEEDEEEDVIINRTVQGSLNTVLHLAARFGRAELAAATVNLRPEMASAENREMETPLHEACREGQNEIAILLLETDLWVAYKVNGRGESALFVACEKGRLEVVKLLLFTFPWLLVLELDLPTSSLHVAASAGHTEIVKEILKVRPGFARKRDRQGCCPLHLACSKGHLQVTQELLKSDLDLSSLQDDAGRTPLHWAAIKGHLQVTQELLKSDLDLSSVQDDAGRTPLHWAVIKGLVNVAKEILSSSLESAEMITKNGETVLHLAVKYNRYEALRNLMETLNIARLVNLPDHDGNTLLHLATAGKLPDMVVYLLKLGVDVNVLNRKGHAALEVVESNATNSCALTIAQALKEAGGKRSDGLPPSSPKGLRIAHPSLSEKWHDNILSMPSSRARPKKSSEFRTQTQSNRLLRAKQIEHQMEGQRRAWNTITMVAVLIATVTFAAGINPPGGFDQGTGKAILGREVTFKVFMVCNIVAFFLSLGIVNALASIDPFQPKSMIKLLAESRKIMWLSTLFMTSAYFAATWTIMPRGKGTKWEAIGVVWLSGGCTVTMFLGIAVMLARHWCQSQASTTNSDVDSSDT